MITGNIDTLELNGVMDDYISLEGTMLTYGPKGDKGDKGDPGDPGFSPIAIVEETSSGATITITDSVGTTSASVLNGTDGEDGQDGYSPIATVTKSGDTATISITDKNGTTTATVSDGVDGQDGQDGAPGQDGYSPSASVSKSGSVTTISVTDKEGTTTATVNDGINGTNGQDGQDGEDGFSPIATVTKSGKIATISITDASGTTTAEIRDGEDGQGSGDMLKATYDTNDNGIVDNAEKVNNHTVLTDVPANAVFTDTTYTAGTNVSISSGNVISATDTTYTAGTGIDITNGVISNTQTSAEWGNITGTLSSQTDLQSALNAKQGTLTAGSNIQINNNTISATDTTYQSKTASQGGTDVSLVTTGEKYTWNNKSDFSGSYTDLSNKPTIPDELADLADDSTHRVVTDTEKTTWSGKQDALVSGTNIKTINNTSILGSGNITISADDEVAIQTTQPSGNETVWINPDESTTPSGNIITNEYSTSVSSGYSCNYLNKMLEEYPSTEVEIGKDMWGYTQYKRTIRFDPTQSIQSLNLTSNYGMKWANKISALSNYTRNNTNTNYYDNFYNPDDNTIISYWTTYNQSGDLILRMYFGSTYIPNYIYFTIEYTKN